MENRLSMNSYENARRVEKLLTKRFDSQPWLHSISVMHDAKEGFYVSLRVLSDMAPITVEDQINGVKICVELREKVYML